MYPFSLSICLQYVEIKLRAKQQARTNFLIAEVDKNRHQGIIIPQKVQCIYFH